MQDIKDVFSYLDSSKSGFIDLKDLATSFRCLGLNPTETEIQDLSDEVKTEKISLEELRVLYEKCKLNSLNNKEEVLKFLKSLDKQNDGFVDSSELKSALCTGGEALQEKDVEAVLKDFEINEEGKVRIDELIEGLFKVKQNLT